MNDLVLKLYDIVREKDIADLDSKAYLMKHKKSGARVLVLSNSDDNKVFSIGFRTPPSCDTGVAHILEHSVLCGSEKYKAKDPFVELCKGSLNTFLNAMTYPDKTVYPVASCNIVDFKNIMDVYLDAVFHPNIAKKEEIFKQEGWHYEILDKDGPLTINGVVYNEMKGAYSSADGYLDRMIMASLYPDNCYGRESGGDPQMIPELSYEEFLEFYDRYYHPSNSYIYMYGDMDVCERLLYLDEEYLSKYDRMEADSQIKLQKPFDKVAEGVYQYPITDSEANGSNDYLSYNVVMGESTDRELYLTMNILDYALLSTPGAPLKQALIDAGIGEDVYSTTENGIRQPFMSIIAKNTSKDKKDEFVNIVRDSLEKLVKEGIDKNSLKAAINYYEFRYREADFGRFPKGLMYGLQSLDSWLYDENEPFMHIEANDTYAFLKDMVDTDYYERFVEKYLLNNTHASVVVLEGVVGLTAVKDKELEEKLKAIRAGLSEEEVTKIYNDTIALKEYQDEPSTEEELLTIPMLKREDLKKEALPFDNDEREVAGIKVIHHNIFTNGIGYVKLLFGADNVPVEKIPYLSLLATMLGYVDTKNYTYRELSNEIDINTGSIAVANCVAQKQNKDKTVNLSVSVNAKALYDKLPKAFELINEIIYNSSFEDYKRLKEIILEAKARLSGKFMNSGHMVARTKALSYISETAYLSEIMGGCEYYQFIEGLIADFDNVKEEIVSNLNNLCKLVFNKENLLVSYTADENGYEAFRETFAEFVKNINENPYQPVVRAFDKKHHNIGLTSSSQVQYVAVGSSFTDAGYEYTGTLKMLSTILGYDYLWTNIRVKGGAYGCMSGFDRMGDMYMVSYRDPKLTETLEVFEKVSDYLENFEVSERDMTKFVIGTMGAIDTPLTPKGKGDRSFGAYISELSFDSVQNERNQILNVTTADIRELGKLVKSTLESKNICVVGNEEKIKENSKIFNEVKSIFNK